jgi:hypothetical protein
MGLKKVKNILLDIVSFGSPQAKVFNLSLILLILGIMPFSSLGSFPIKCVFKNLIFPLIFRGNCPSSGLFANCNCPACGLTRAMSRLLHGDFVGAYNLNKLVFVVFLVMVVLIIINLVKSIKYYKKTGRIY